MPNQVYESVLVASCKETDYKSMIVMVSSNLSDKSMGIIDLTILIGFNNELSVSLRALR